MGKLGEAHPFFAALLDSAHPYREHRPDLVGAATGRVLEVGCGPGHNLPYYPRQAELVLTDPDPRMLERARRRAQALGARAQVVAAQAEQLPFPDAAFDTVVCTAVFCSVEDPLLALAEVMRVLRPGGRFRFMEHVRATAPGWARFQDAITPVWRWVGAGCHPNRDTGAAIRRAGFILEDFTEFPYGPYPVRPHIRGVARKPE